jgi:hypothetical protein
MALTEQNINDILKEARDEANKAGSEIIPEPMQVGNTVVGEGVCGYAWVTISGRGKFAQTLKKRNMVRKSLTGPGYTLWSTVLFDYSGQSYERTKAAAGAIARVLNSHGIKAVPNSRID